MEALLPEVEAELDRVAALPLEERADALEALSERLRSILEEIAPA